MNVLIGYNSRPIIKNQNKDRRKKDMYVFYIVLLALSDAS